MQKDLYAVYMEYLAKLRAKVLAEFDAKVDSVIPEDESEILPNFAEVMNTIRSEALESFNKKSSGKFVERRVSWFF